MSRRARELDALNLGQGFPDYDIDPRLSELLAEAMREGHNQYAPMEGLPSCGRESPRSCTPATGTNVDPDTEMTVTSVPPRRCLGHPGGGGPGDEVIVFDPAYDSYEPAVRLAGGRCRAHAAHPPGFGYDWERVRRA